MKVFGLYYSTAGEKDHVQKQVLLARGTDHGFLMGPILEPRPKALKLVYLEITNLCNRDCSFCPKTTRPGAFMPQSLFEKAVREAAVVSDRVALHVMGEPLLDPDLPLRIQAAAKARLEIMITTNATLIDLESPNTQALFHPAVVQLNFSLHALDPQSAPDRQSFDRLVDFLLVAREKKPDLYLNLRLWNLESLSQRQEIETSPQGFFLRELAKRLNLSLPEPLIPAGRKSRLLAGRLYLHSDTVFQWPGHEKEHGEGTCRALLDQVAVLADGRVVPCCLDHEGKTVLGKLQDSTLSEILQFERVKEIKEGFEKGFLVEPLCQKCSYSRRFARP